VEGNAVLPSAFRLGKSKVRKLGEVSKDPGVCIAHKRVLLVLFFLLLMQTTRVPVVFCFLPWFFCGLDVG